jgi:CMP-N,N'-diacetyllegionaminic acid synthase
MTVISIIPARGGSKGVPGKNIKCLASLPLIAHSILNAKNSKKISRTFVSTDSCEIANVAEEYGAEIIYRPALLADDMASSEAALIHALSCIRSRGIFPTLIVFLQCTSPIRTEVDIDKAIEKLEKENADSLLSVSPSHRFLWQEIDHQVKSINYDYKCRPRRQDMTPQYVENGSIYVLKPWVLENLNNRLGGKISLFPMSEVASHEIDTLLDFEIAEFLLKQWINSDAD